MRSTKKSEIDSRQRADSAGLLHFVRMIAEKYPYRDQISFVCIGTDRSSGDSFGPLVGSMLIERGWGAIIGTLEHPCDAHSYHDLIKGIPVKQIVIAIDACLGHPSSVGKFLVREGVLQPGQATGEQLQPVGNYSIAAVVNEHGPKPYWTLQTTSLYMVMQMAKQLVAHIDEAWSVPQ